MERLIKKQIDSKMEYSSVFRPITYPYNSETILFNKYCKECKLTMKQKVEMLEDRSGIRIKNHFNFHKL